MEKQQEQKIELKEDQIKAKKEGQELYEMTQTRGWKTVAGWLRDMAFHSWVDPRSTDVKDEWVWRELNAFHAANVTKELLEKIAASIEEADRLQKIELGQVKERPMKI